MKNSIYFNLLKSLSLLILIFIMEPTYSQQAETGLSKGWSLNINAGPSIFYGDIDNYRFYRCFQNNSEWRFAYGLIVQKKVSSLFTLRGQLLNGELSGSKRKDTLWFENNVIETSMSATLDMTNLILGDKKRFISVYAMAGIGLSHWKTVLKDRETNQLIAGNGHNTGSGLFGRTLEAVIPFGVGVDFRVTDRWKINVEGTLRPVNSDVLDGNAGGYPFDFYSYNFVGVTYTFNSGKAKKPKLPSQKMIADEYPEVTEINEIKPTEELVVIKEKKDSEAKTLEDMLLEEDASTGLYESPWPGVEFTVQIAASKTNIDPKKIAAQFNINGMVSVSEQDGWYRYTIGQYIKYWKAREYRNFLLTQNNVEGAFVVAYREGKRITLAELVNFNFNVDENALLVENQRPVVPVAFGVQLMASHDGTISSNVLREMYEIDLDVYKEFSNGWFQYTAGNFTTYQDAAKLRNKLKSHSIRDAFIVGYKNGKRVDLNTILQ